MIHRRESMADEETWGSSQAPIGLRRTGCASPPTAVQGACARRSQEPSWLSPFEADERASTGVDDPSWWLVEQGGEHCGAHALASLGQLIGGSGDFHQAQCARVAVRELVFDSLRTSPSTGGVCRWPRGHQRWRVSRRRDDGVSRISRTASVMTPHLVSARHTVERAVYGTVSVLAVIAGAAGYERSATKVLVFASVSSVVFWGVHVYAGVLADTGPGGSSPSLAVRKAMRRELGVFGGVALPLAVLLLGALGVLEHQRAISWSMWAGVLVLFATPLVWLRPKERGWGSCLLASAVGGSLGLVLILLKVTLK